MPETTAKQAPTPPKAGPAVEEVKNCPACKKPLKKARRYYRNGAYYCNINCFKKANAAKVGEGSPVLADKPGKPSSTAEAVPAPSDLPKAGPAPTAALEQPKG